MIKLVILDVDGVLTKDKYYDTEGNVIAKAFCDQDFTAIKMFKAVGVKVCFLSGDRNINEKIAQKRNIDFFYCPCIEGVINKASILPEIMKHYDIKKLDEIIYVGDDYYDISIMVLLKNKACPSSANPCLMEITNMWFLKARAGEGVVAELYDILRRIDDYPSCYPKDYL